MLLTSFYYIPAICLFAGFVILVLYAITLAFANDEKISEAVYAVDEKKVGRIFRIWLYGWWVVLFAAVLTQIGVVAAFACIIVL